MVLIGKGNQTPPAPTQTDWFVECNPYARQGSRKNNRVRIVPAPPTIGAGAAVFFRSPAGKRI
jgi:hypothetical protein